MRNTVIIAVALASILALGFGAGRGFCAGEVPKDILDEVKNPKDLPKGTYAKIEVYEGEALQHQENRGKEEKDDQAGNKIAWVARVDDNEAGHTIFGPYIEIDEGKYVAFFRVKMLEDAGEDVVVTLDACVEYGQSVLDQKEVIGADLKKGKYAQVPLVFDYPGGQLETRVFWPAGYAVAIDSITLFRVK
ncbi:hypothetical protein COY52_10730 [Candidatus Desantisbacteria bacterium CG_4_10_14_0_8_um_filter_48_22]|uniref:Uncharacterized protein n=1 Tax=Candidatus Desantisbacteria bacterium CG_4_10_14_0_8_um_filter_48_22 TaxID=1974543 RepID=A0A2M7S5X3_9BACT|nr:MAG: hypothetical protein AUJ67_04275 [Candidatus Desantisbacteria bacterium CG1_02_49_89]PIV55693.1 MAG: hypothetical protein COS16_06285 [Candidatus Desantisbacteria bacterium CG02_land_8_20_14_3_00_49_13]PIZ14920.1 MAG: hypothetical protein COY52_10730 [Candidatus Desantisbacteria bacterium CG_4_10_14_0_8_um_filter_48_22]PJB27971.1 MAG: hypothetical protein CO111_02730 [Candidatus Desantisbacteria bacterium CG_4_9_14_3_um_filter_50_7]